MDLKLIGEKLRPFLQTMAEFFGSNSKGIVQQTQSDTAIREEMECCTTAGRRYVVVDVLEIELHYLVSEEHPNDMDNSLKWVAQQVVEVLSYVLDAKILMPTLDEAEAMDYALTLCCTARLVDATPDESVCMLRFLRRYASLRKNDVGVGCLNEAIQEVEISGSGDARFVLGETDGQGPFLIGLQRGAFIELKKKSKVESAIAQAMLLTSPRSA